MPWDSNPYNAHSSGGFTNTDQAFHSYGGYRGIDNSAIAANASRISHGGRRRRRKTKGGACGMCNKSGGKKKTRKRMMSHKKCHCLCHKGKICTRKNCPCTCHRYESQFGGSGYSMPGYKLSANHLNQANPTPFAPYP